MGPDPALTKWINSFAGHSAILDRLVVFVATWGVVLLVAIIALRWWSTHDRKITRYGAICCGLATALGLCLNHFLLLFVDRSGRMIAA